MISEDVVEKFFRENYQSFGFSKIRKIKEGSGEPGDYIGLRNGKWLRIELERTTSGFFLHKQKVRQYIDVIVCYRFSEPYDVERRNEIRRGSRSTLGMI